VTATAPSPKVMALVVRTPGTAPEALVRRALRDPGWDGVTGWSFDVAESAHRAGVGRPVAVVSARLDDPAAAAGIAERLATDAPVDRAWLVDEHRQWDGAAGEPFRLPVTGVKRMSFLRRVAGIDHDEFARHWTQHHTGLARRHHPGLWRYTQDVVVRPLLPGTGELDGIAELTMRLRLDFTQLMYDSPEGRRVIAEDVRRFIDLPAGWRLTTREYLVR